MNGQWRVVELGLSAFQTVQAGCRRTRMQCMDEIRIQRSALDNGIPRSIVLVSGGLLGRHARDSSGSQQDARDRSQRFQKGPVPQPLVFPDIS
jgi:hypothetical protein